ncbi:MAG: hypothetical protein PUK21_01225 [Peptostreptococcaceae bacterium]|nr:hypothetical protein [Peptostreptococcaceae bacterium]MDY5739630.1 hypothetical protein [Anaerovoracaceae bacterium]
MKKLDKRQIEYMARAIIPELYERQADTDAWLEECTRRYFAEDERKAETVLTGE